MIALMYFRFKTLNAKREAAKAAKAEITGFLNKNFTYKDEHITVLKSAECRKKTKMNLAMSGLLHIVEHEFPQAKTNPFINPREVITNWIISTMR